MVKRLPKVMNTRMSDLVPSEGENAVPRPEAPTDATTEAVPAAPAQAAPQTAPTGSTQPPRAVAESRRARAQGVVDRHTLYACVTATVPQPGLDVAGVGTATYRMVAQLLALYEQPADAHRIRQVLGSAAVGLIGPSVGRVGAWTLTGLLPVAGLWIPLLSAVSTAVLVRQIGASLVGHLEHGGSLDNWSRLGGRRAA